jgi:hypothetical protein
MGVLMKCFLTVLKSVALTLLAFAAGVGALALLVLISVVTAALLGLPEGATPVFIIGYMSLFLGIAFGVSQCAEDRSKS